MTAQRSRGRILLAAAVVVLAIAAALVVRSWSASDDAQPAQPGSSRPALTPTPTTSSPVTPTPTSSNSGPPEPTTSGAPAPDGLPQVTIETPTPDEHARIPVHATGTVVAFEAVAHYEVLQGGQVFVNGPLYADRGAPERGRWETDIELPMGAYTLVVFVESPKDGSRIASAQVRFNAG